jgi:hypothetical protein
MLPEKEGQAAAGEAVSLPERMKQSFGEHPRRPLRESNDISQDGYVLGEKLTLYVTHPDSHPVHPAVGCDSLVMHRMSDYRK